MRVDGDADNTETKLRDLILKNLDKACMLLFGRVPTIYQKLFIEKVLRREGSGKYILVASTRAGKTTATSMLVVLMALAYPNEDIVVVAPTLRQSNILFGLVRGYFFESKILAGMVDRKKGFTREIIYLRNGSTIRMLTSGSHEGLLGFGASVLIIDETASIDDGVIKTRLLRMLASPRNREKPILVLLGTPHRAGFLYEAWLSDEYEKFRWTWRDAVQAGIMSIEMVEYFRRIMTKHEFMRWFEAEFIPEDEGLFFNPIDIRECAIEGISRAIDPPILRYDYRIYCGVDVARFGDDETTMVCIKAPNGFREGNESAVVVGYWRWKKMNLAETIGKIQNIIDSWNPDMVAIDTVGLGAGVYDILAERLSGNVVEAFELAKRDEVFLFLKKLFEEKRIILPKDEYFLAQFDTYRVKYDSWGKPRISKTPGKRDDLADALVYAIYCAMVYEGVEFEIRPLDLNILG